MKTKLFLTLLIGITSLSFSQGFSNSERAKIVNYYLINKLNDTIQVSVTNPKRSFHCGFNIYNNNGQLKSRVNPEHFNYLILENSLGETTKLKSLPNIKKTENCKNRNVFVPVLIENSDQDIKKGKVDFYCHEFTSNRTTVLSSDDSIIQKGSVLVHSKIFYFKDLNGLHIVKNYKYHFKRYPKILGKQLYKKMMRSDKGEKQFLLDYLTEYNRKIDRL